MPKKSLLHELAVRVPTLLIDEYRASSTCVCGAKLQTSSNAPRVRVHQDGGGACATLQCGICDRDELAVLNHHTGGTALPARAAMAGAFAATASVKQKRTLTDVANLVLQQTVILVSAEDKGKGVCLRIKLVPVCIFVL